MPKNSKPGDSVSHWRFRPWGGGGARGVPRACRPPQTAVKPGSDAVEPPRHPPSETKGHVTFRKEFKNRPTPAVAEQRPGGKNGGHFAMRFFPL